MILANFLPEFSIVWVLFSTGMYPHMPVNLLK
jgi:hypothetical protein